MKDRFLYIRVLRKVNHSVFCVTNGQKTYYDPIANKKVAYSSGQQVKRSIIDAILENLNDTRSEIVFNYQLKGKDTITEKEAISTGDPRYIDQLLGGWMNAPTNSVPLKRRSPLSVSAMYPLHPYLSALNNENITYDRSDVNTSKVTLKDAKGNPMSVDDMHKFLDDNNRNLPSKKYIQDQSRTTGLFVYDVAIDLHRLFNIELDDKEPSMSKELISELISSGWIETNNESGRWLSYPELKRGDVIKSIANGVLNWRITSNQSRTFSLMECAALAVSTNANSIAYSIRAKLIDDRRAMVVVDDNISDVDVFITPTLECILSDVDGDSNALLLAEKLIIDKLS